MDTLTVTWKKAFSLNEQIIVKYISLGNGTCYKLTSFIYENHFSKLFVAIERRGAFFFPIDSFIHGEYVLEKLNLCSLSDANILADWINVQIGHFEKQQGHYSIFHIEEEKEEERSMLYKPNNTLFPIVLSP